MTLGTLFSIVTSSTQSVWVNGEYMVLGPTGLVKTSEHGRNVDFLVLAPSSTRLTWDWIGRENWATSNLRKPRAPWTKHTLAWKHKVRGSLVPSTTVLLSTEEPLQWPWRLCGRIRASFWWKSSRLKVCPWVWSWSLLAINGSPLCPSLVPFDP